MPPSRIEDVYTDTHYIGYDEKFWTHFDMPNLDIRSAAVVTEWDVWFSGRSGYLLHYDGNRMQMYRLPVASSLDVNGFGKIVIDRNHHVWVAAHKAGVFRFDGENWVQYTAKQGLPVEVDDLLIGPDGVLWALMAQTGSIYRYNGQAWEFYWSFEHVEGRPTRINSMAIDLNGKFWFTSHALFTLEHGKLYVYPAEVFQDFTVECGLGSVDVAPDGSIWLLTCANHNLLHLVDEKLLTVYKIPGLEDQVPNGVRIAPDNSVWISTETTDRTMPLRAFHWDGKVWTIYGGFPTPKVYAWQGIDQLTVTERGTVWIVTETDIYHYKP